MLLGRRRCSSKVRVATFSICSFVSNYSVGWRKNIINNSRLLFLYFSLFINISFFVKACLQYPQLFFLSSIEHRLPVFKTIRFRNCIILFQATSIPHLSSYFPPLCFFICYFFLQGLQIALFKAFLYKAFSNLCPKPRLIPFSQNWFVFNIQHS